MHKCLLCGKEISKNSVKSDDKYFCDKCVKKLPRCMLDHIDGFSDEEIKRIHESGLFKPVPNVYLKTEDYKNRHEYKDIALTKKYLKFSDVLINLRDIRDFYVDYKPIHKFGKIAIGFLTITVTTKKPFLELEDAFANISAVITKDNSYELDYSFEEVTRFLSGRLDLLDDRIKGDIEVYKAKCRIDYLEDELNNEREYSKSLERKIDELNKGMNNIDSIESAKILFMLPNKYTKEDVKIQRKRLMKGFHPDGNDGMSGEYAKKINTAYDLLMKSI